MQYEPRPAEQMEQLESLVRSAVGFDPGRGDALELVNMQFADLPVSVEDGSDTYFGFTTADIGNVIAMISLPWAVKFLWGPVVDRFGINWMFHCQVRPG